MVWDSKVVASASECALALFLSGYLLKTAVLLLGTRKFGGLAVRADCAEVPICRGFGFWLRLANERRAEQGLPALPKITPHSLRRTWAMLAAQAWELMRFADEPAAPSFTRQVTRTDDQEFRPANRPMDDFSPSGELDRLTNDQ